MSNNMIVVKSQIDNTRPYHIYYDLEILNNDTVNSLPVPLKFNEVRNSSYLTDPDSYYVSVIRFSVETGSSLPVIIPQAQVGDTQYDPNLLIYSFTLKYKTYEVQTYITYIPTDLSQQFPRPPVKFQDLESNYYFVYTYQQFISMVNNCLTICFNALNTLVTAGGDTLSTTNPPWMDIDPQSLNIVLNADELGYANTLTDPIELYMNVPCYTLFNSFQVINYGFSNITNGKNVKFVIQNSYNTNVFQLSTYNALQMYTENTPTAVWCPIQSIIFTSTQIPVVQELVAVPRVYGTNSSLFNVGNNNNIQPILTDFIIPLSALNQYKPNIIYSPQGEPRLIDMYGNKELNAVNFNVYWKDRYSNLHEILLPSGCGGSLKLMFRRKDYNNVTL